MVALQLIELASQVSPIINFGEPARHLGYCIKQGFSFVAYRHHIGKRILIRRDLRQRYPKRVFPDARLSIDGEHYVH